jgi:peptidoglycan/LPS O-acetylase OafA/YrhL
VSPHAPQISSGASRGERRADIQGLRAVAILLVVLYHGGFHLRGGFTGVDVFFAISGFVITGTLLRELDARGTVDLARFYSRRVRRLLPALAVMVAVVALVGIVATPIAGMRITSLTGVFASIFAANVYLARLGTGYFDVSTSLDPLLHTWTLGVEEQFYIVFPTLLLGAWLLARRRHWSPRIVASLTLGMLTVLSGILAVLVARGHLAGPHAVQYAFYLSPTRAWEFGAGALLALAVAPVSRVPRAATWPIGMVGATAITLGAMTLTPTDASPLRLAAFPVFGSCALIAAGTLAASGPSRFLGARPLAWIGDLSYSWYLWHWPVIVFAKALWPHAGTAAPVAAAASLLPAWASYRYVEAPIRTRRSLVGRRAIVLGGACVAVGLTTSAMLLGSHDLLQRNAAVRSWNRSQTPHLDEVNGCDSPVPLGARRGFHCTWLVPHARGRVVLVGDSNAGHFSEPVIDASRQLGYDTTVVTLDGCPYVDLIVRPRSGSQGCRQFYLETTAALIRQRPNLVIIGGRTDQYVYEDGVGEPGQPLSHSTPVRLTLWVRGLTSTLRALNGHGIPVVVVDPVPSLPVPEGDCAVIRILTATCAGSVSRSRVAAELGPVIRAQDRSVRTASRSTVVDFEDELCGRRCSAMRGNITLFLNALHLSVDGAKTLTRNFREIIANSVRRH